MMQAVTLGSDECLIFSLMICRLIVHLVVASQAFLVARAGEQQPTCADLFGANIYRCVKTKCCWSSGSDLLIALLKIQK
jgi:hypothetical protein